MGEVLTITINSFVRLTFLDENYSLASHIDIFHDLPITSLTSVVVQDSFIYVGGDWIPDTTNNYDAFMAKVDFNGNIVWFTGKDLGARDTGRDIVIGPNGNIYHGIQTQTQDIIFNFQMGYWIIQDAPVTTSTEKINYARSYNIYPNPASTTIHIEGDEELREVMAFSMDGRKVDLLPLSADTYDVSALTNGIYLFVLRDKMNRRHYLKFIKVSER